MQDKNTLINSMNNLINYIKINHKNQQQMFGSLTHKQFDKIMNNLQDPLQRLRITTVHLLTELLYNNETLKKKFCGLMGIHYSQDSNIVLNNNLSRILERYRNKIPQIFIIIKSYNKILHKGKHPQPLFWFINPRRDKLTIQHLYREDIVEIMNLLASHHNNTVHNIRFDPIDCIFGLNLNNGKISQILDERVPTSESVLTDGSKTRNSLKSGDISSRSRDIDDTFTLQNMSVSYHQPYLPTSTRSNAPANNSAFLRQNNKQDQYNFSKNIYPKKNQTFTEESPPQLIQLNHSMNLQTQPYSYTASKKQNEELLAYEEKEKYSNRLSLRTNDYYGGNKKNNTFEFDDRNFDYKRQSKQLHDNHHHGIKIIAPRHSLKGSQKISITNNGSYTDRYNIQKAIVFPDSAQRKRMNDRVDQSTQNVSNAQKLRTIHLGKGSKGWQTSRQNKKKNIIIQN